jgi:hypothetical protein
VGSLKLPTSGLVYFDSQAVIYSVETHADYWPLLEPVWEAAEAGAFEIVSSGLLLLETLVGPLRSGDQDLVCSVCHQRPRVSSGAGVTSGDPPR